LLESISLADAQGVIANFSGGEDLSLYEVGEAVGHIRELTGGDVDVVMGLTQDDRMSERAQVILVVTGLGAKSLAEILPGAEVIQNKTTSAEVIATEPEPTASAQIEESYEAVPASILNDLDVPAFLRKRARMNVPALEGN
jgi:cell division protein FtsZ